jgi:hypothetical protein
MLWLQIASDGLGGVCGGRGERIAAGFSAGGRAEGGGGSLQPSLNS